MSEYQNLCLHFIATGKKFINSYSKSAGCVAHTHCIFSVRSSVVGHVAGIVDFAFRRDLFSEPVFM